jgi:hypothetical protein
MLFGFAAWPKREERWARREGKSIKKLKKYQFTKMNKMNGREIYIGEVGWEWILDGFIFI